jgi:hypothetical protein
MPQGPPPRAGARAPAEARRRFARKGCLVEKPDPAELKGAGPPGWAAHEPGRLAVIGKNVCLGDAAALTAIDGDVDRVHEGIDQGGIGHDHLVADRNGVERPQWLHHRPAHGARRREGAPSFSKRRRICMTPSTQKSAIPSVALVMTETATSRPITTAVRET